MANELAFELIAKLLDDVSKPAAEIKRALGTINQSVQQQQKFFESNAKAHERMVAGMTKGWIALAAASTASYEAIIKPMEQANKLEDTFKTLQIQTGRTATKMSGLKEEFEDLAHKWHVGVNELAVGASLVDVKLRNNAASLKQVMDIATQFSRGMEVDLNAAIKSTTPLLEIFKVKTDDLGKAMDAVAVFFKSGLVPIDVYQQNIANLATSAGRLGEKGLPGLKRSLALVNSEILNGIEAGEAFSDVIKIFDKMDTPKVRRMLGPNAYTGSPEERLKAINDYIYLFGEQRAAHRAELLFGPKAIEMWQRVNESRSQYAKAYKDEQGSEGAAAKAAKERLGEVGESWKELSTEVGILTDSIGGKLAPAFSSMMHQFAEGLANINAGFELVINDKKPGLFSTWYAFIDNVKNLAKEWGIGPGGSATMPAGPAARVQGPIPPGVMAPGLLSGAALGSTSTGAWHDIKGSAGGIPGMPANMLPTAGAHEVVKPLVSIDDKMSSLIDIMRGNILGEGGLGGLPGGGTGGSSGRGAGGGKGGGTTGGGGGGRTFGDVKGDKGSTPGTFKQKAPGIMKKLMDKYGLTDKQAAGIVGNLGEESAGFSQYHEGGKTPGTGGVGWAQWTGPRRKAFEAWTASHGLDPRSDEASYRYLTEGDPQTAAAIAAVKGQSTVSGSMQAFEQSFEGAGVKAYGVRERYDVRGAA